MVVSYNGVPQNGLFIIGNLTKMDDLGVPHFRKPPYGHRLYRIQFWLTMANMRQLALTACCPSDTVRVCFWISMHIISGSHNLQILEMLGCFVLQVIWALKILSWQLVYSRNMSKYIVVHPKKKGYTIVHYSNRILLFHLLGELLYQATVYQYLPFKRST